MKSPVLCNIDRTMKTPHKNESHDDADVRNPNNFIQ